MAAKFQKLEAQYQHLLAEYNILKCKLECKTDALLILSHEQGQCRSERDQYKLMADQLRERYSALKKRVEGWGPSLLGVYDLHGWKGEREQSLVQLLCELKEENKSLQYEVDDLKQKLTDAHGDIKILRDEISRSRSSSISDDFSSNNFPTCDREKLVKHLEVFKHRCIQLERDLKAVLDEKEELVTARDAFRHKFERLNQQLNCLLRGDQHSYVDIDGVIMENRYLQERIKQVVEEKNMAVAALSKCKALLDKKRSGPGFRFSSVAAGLAISAKQVEQLLQNNHFLEKANDSSGSNDVRNLVLTLLEALSDNTIALSHQKKTNKILGNRVSELEQKLKTTEAKSLWQFHDAGRITYLLSKSQSEDALSCENLTPQASESSVGGSQCCSTPVPSDDEFEDKVISMTKDEHFSAVDLVKDTSVESNFSDLDLLPTKDVCPEDFSFRKDYISQNSDSKSFTALSSPKQQTESTHSDSDISPKKFILRRNSSASVQNSPVYCKHSGVSSLDVDDLPPTLQKLLASALLDIENGLPDQKIVGGSPSHNSHTPVESDDPSC